MTPDERDSYNAETDRIEATTARMQVIFAKLNASNWNEAVLSDEERSALDRYLSDGTLMDS